jgi:hypothetical protein
MEGEVKGKVDPLDDIKTSRGEEIYEVASFILNFGVRWR